MQSVSDNLSHLPIAVLPLCETYQRIREVRRIELIPQKRGRHVASLHQPDRSSAGSRTNSFDQDKARECDRSYLGLNPPSSRHNAAIMPYLRVSYCPHVHSKNSHVRRVLHGADRFLMLRNVEPSPLSVDRGMIPFYCTVQSEPAPSTCVTPQCHTITLLGTACETSPPKKSFNWLQRQTRHAGPSLVHQRCFQQIPRSFDGYESFLAEVRSLLPIAASLQRSTSGKPHAPQQCRRQDSNDILNTVVDQFHRTEDIHTGDMFRILEHLTTRAMA